MKREKELDQLLKITKEDHKILHGLQKSARISRMFSILYWILIIGSISGVYYYIQPYLDILLDLYHQVRSVIRGV
jgi:hypothetical protein